MRVVHFRQAFSPLSETFIYDSIVEMERQGADCHVVTLRRANERDRPFDKVTVLELPPRWHPMRLGYRMKSLWDGNTRATYAWPLIRKEIDRVLGPLKPDVIHAHFGPDAVLIAPVAQSRGIPLVVTFYGYDFSIHEVLRRWEDEYGVLMRQAAAVIGISNYVCRALVDLGADPSRLACVRLGVEAERFTYSDPASRYDGRTVRCLHVGRLVPKKAPLVLIEAFRTAIAEVGDERDLTLTIVGDGPLMPQVRRRVAELGLDGRVQLAGAFLAVRS